ncbi:ABC transporter substrate-binding protein [Leptolyngbya sp. FACHB-261]|uniref:ABC transporter substrate-binding protein n=1 Tax=Leptolyngbya sp. FACHB-261 TaxID=2692806 RepID=UPI0016831CA7|nr:ABC transporter substrate-binding protein [Leptolyngbya sp. FACHB-261]MBD2102191.1 amino acid ABC transporter substrate-binding protein [Leptolyngbya sp. FACHB-261]
MAGNRKEGPLLLLSFLITAALLGLGWFFLSRSGLNPGALLNSQGSPGTGGLSLPSGSGERLSQGERLLFTDNPNPDKQAGVAALAAGDFQTATTQLEAALKADRNDPEALIYLNNARIGNAAAPTIATVVPVSSSPNSARELLRGVAQAQDEAVRTGQPFKVVIGNDNNDPNQAKELANTLVQDSNILAVVGHGTSTTSLAAAPIYEENKLVMIAPTSTSTELAQVQKGSSNYIFRTVPSDQFTGTALARYLLKGLGKSKAMIFFNAGSSYSQSLNTAFTTTLGLEGGQVVQQVDLSQGNPSEQLGGTAAEVLVLLPDAATLPQAIQVAQANQNRLPLLGDDALYTVDSLRQGGAALNGMVLPVPWHPLKTADSNFTQAANRLWGGDINWRTALSYDAVQALRVALAKARSRAEVEQVLAAPGFTASGATGPINFLPSGDRNGGAVLVRIEPGNRSKTGYDFVPLP